MDTPEIATLQNELGSLTCEEQKLSQFKKLPPCVFIALAQRYLDAAQRVALAASEKYARETLVTTGELAPTVWRVTLLSQADAVRMLSTVPPRAYAPLRWTNELVLLDSDTRGFSRAVLLRYWHGLSLFVANAPALSVLRMRKAWRLSSLVFAAVARRPAMQLEVASTLTPQKVDDLGVDADVLAREGRLLCSKLASSNRRLEGPNPWPSDDSAWLRLWNQPALVELDLSGSPLVELPEALVPLRTLRVLRANYMQLQEAAVLARGPPMLEILTLSGNKTLRSLLATYACASSLVRLELGDGTVDDMGSRSGHLGGWDFIKDLPNLRRLKFYYQKYEHMRHIDVVASHPCFAPSVLEFTGLSLGRHDQRHLRAHVLDAVPSMSPSQVRDLELAAASVEQDMRPNGYGDGKSVMEAYLVELRATMAGKPHQSPPPVVVENLDDVKRYTPLREHRRTSRGKLVEDVYHSIAMMPAYSGKSFEELRLEDYQRADADPDDPLAAANHHWRVAAMKGDALAAANAAFAAVAAERDRLAVERDGLAAAAAGRLAFRAPSPVAESPKEPFVFGASAAEERVVTPETHSDKPFAFGANASGQEEPFVFGAKPK
jgi:hypothetical protein